MSTIGVLVDHHTKKCKTCGLVKIITDFRKDKNVRRGDCKACESKKGKERQKIKKMESMVNKAKTISPKVMNAVKETFSTSSYVSIMNDVNSMRDHIHLSLNRIALFVDDISNGESADVQLMLMLASTDIQIRALELFKEDGEE